MSREKTFAAAQFTRREAMSYAGRTGLGVASLFAGVGQFAAAAAQGGLPVTVAPPSDPNFSPAPTWRTELRQLAPNVYAYIQGGGPNVVNLGVSNAGLIVGGEHLFAIDALGAPLQSKAFIAAAQRASGGKSFDRLLNTHHHFDHVAGNQFFGPVEIFSHPYCRDEVVKSIATTPHMWAKQEGGADGTEERKVVPPTTTFTDKITSYYGDTIVEFSFVGPAHTWGDVVAYLPQHKVLFAGDIAFFYVAPFAHNGYIAKWLAAIDKIMVMDVEIIVPGHGPLGGKKDLAELAQYFRLLETEARKRYDTGMSAGQAAAEIPLGKFANWIGPERIVMNTVRLYAEFNGSLAPDMDVKATQLATDQYNAVMAARAKRS